MISSHHVFNILQEERPDVVETLTKPIWYFDRKGETSKGQKEWVRTSVFYWYDGKLYTKYVQAVSQTWGSVTDMRSVKDGIRTTLGP